MTTVNGGMDVTSGGGGAVGAAGTSADAGTTSEQLTHAGQQPSRQQESGQINVGSTERAVSVAGGSILALFGLKRGGVTGLVSAAIGGALIHRGATGHCQLNQVLGINTAEGTEHKHGIHIEQAFLINRPVEQLYAFWRDFTNLPQIMTHLDRVDVTDDRRSHWVARLPNFGGKQLEWDAEITAEVPNQEIGWRSLDGADVANSGVVRFAPALGDRGTEVHVFIDYIPPAGVMGNWIAKLFGENPSRLIREDLRNFKRLMETGEIPTIIGQPHGTCTGQGEYYTESERRPLFT